MDNLRKISLSGNNTSLNIVERIFKNEMINVFTEEENKHKTFFLTSTSFDNLDEKEIRRESDILLKEINTACCFIKEYFVPIEVGEIYIGNCIYITIKEQIIMHDDLCIIEDGVEKDFDGETILHIFSKLKKDPFLNKILGLFYEKGKDWVNLYRILDLFKEMKIDVVKHEWITNKDLKLLTHTANSPGAIGNDARHGKQSGIPPSNPMSLSMAQVLVKKIVLHYIESLDE